QGSECVLSPRMSARRREVRDDRPGAVGIDLGNARLDGSAGTAAESAGTGGAAGAWLHRLPARRAEDGSRRPPQPLLAGTIATGAPAVHQDVRAVRLQLSAVNRRTPGSRTANAALHPRGEQCDLSGTAWGRQDAPQRGAGGSG